MSTASVEPASGVITFCPLYFRTVASSGVCHYADQATILMHELSHIHAIKGTLDIDNGGIVRYGYDSVRALTEVENLWHADTYALFAQGQSFQISKDHT